MEYISPEDPDFSLWFAFKRAHEAIHKVRKAEVRRIKLSTIEIATLLIIRKRKNKATPAEISRQLLKDPHSISQLLARMEKRGLVENIKGVPRKNMVLVKLTSQGQKAFRQSMGVKNLKKIFAVLSESEKEQLREYFEKIQGSALELLH